MVISPDAFNLADTLNLPLHKYLLQFTEKQYQVGKINQLNPQDRHLELFQQYERLKMHGVTDFSLSLYGIPIGILSDVTEGNFEFRKNNENGVLAFEPLPLFPERDDSIHLLYLPGENGFQKSEFEKIIIKVQNWYPNQTIAYLWHKNGNTQDGYLQCNCSGGDVDHRHIIVIPNSNADLLESLSNLDLSTQLKKNVDQIRLDKNIDNSDTNLYEERFEQNAQFFSAQLDERPAYVFGIIQNRKFAERTLILNRKISGQSGFLRNQLNQLLTATSGIDYNSGIEHHFHLGRLLEQEAELKNKIIKKMLIFKYRFLSNFKNEI